MNEKSLAREMLEDYKKANRRMFVIIIIVLVMWFLTIGYLVYLLNDIGTEEITEVSTTQEVSDIDTVGGDIINGDAYGKDKAN